MHQKLLHLQAAVSGNGCLHGGIGHGLKSTFTAADKFTDGNGGTVGCGQTARVFHLHGHVADDAPAIQHLIHVADSGNHAHKLLLGVGQCNHGLTSRRDDRRFPCQKRNLQLHSLIIVKLRQIRVGAHLVPHLDIQFFNKSGAGRLISIATVIADRLLIILQRLLIALVGTGQGIF